MLFGFTARMICSPAFKRGILQGVTDFVALLVDRSDHRPGGYPQSDQSGLGKLQACLDGLGHRIGRAKRIKMPGMIGIARARHDNDVGPDRAHMLDHGIDKIAAYGW